MSAELARHHGKRSEQARSIHKNEDSRMNRVTAGDSFSFTYNVGSAGETYTAKAVDAQGHYMTATTTEAAPDVTVSVDEGQWRNGQLGHGWIEIRNEATNAVVKRERFRIMAGLSADYTAGVTYG